MLSFADCCPDGVGGAHVRLIDIIQPGNVGSEGDKMDITWQYYGLCCGMLSHLHWLFMLANEEHNENWTQL